MTFRSILTAAALALAGLSASAQTDGSDQTDLSAGHHVAERFLQGDVDAIWEASTPEMREVFGSSKALTVLRDDLRADFGEEDTLLSEAAETRDGHVVYTRVSRWTDAPKPLEFVVTLDGEDRIAGFLLRPRPVAAPSRFLGYETRATLRLPVTGEWFVYWGGRGIEDNYHAADRGQRFAVDLLVMQDGASHSGDPSQLDSYHCWGRPILAPADGVVARVVDGLPDQSIGDSDPANPAGNHVVIDFGNDEYGFLAHLRQGSVEVAEGEAVAAGQQIGRCGNSGNTSEPHLHVHLQTSPTLGQGEGLPAQFTDYEADGVPVDRGEPRKGEIVEAAD